MEPSEETEKRGDPQEEIEGLKDELAKARKQINELLDQVEVLKERAKSDSSPKQPQSRYWTSEEHERFLEGIKRFGTKDVKAISNFVGSRNSTQVRTHAQKYFLRLGREKTNKDEPGEGRDSFDEMRLPSLTSSSSDSSSSGLLAPLTEAVHLQSPETKGKRRSPHLSAKKRAESGQNYSLPSHIIAETSDAVLAVLKDWTQLDYNSFVEGLVFYGEENDVERKCQLIAQNYLPKFSVAKVLHCHEVLQSITNRENQEAPKRVKREQLENNRGPVLSPVFHPGPISPSLHNSGSYSVIPASFFGENSNSRFRLPGYNPQLGRSQPEFSQMPVFHSQATSYEGTLPSAFLLPNYEEGVHSTAPTYESRRASYPFDSFISSPRNINGETNSNHSPESNSIRKPQQITSTTSTSTSSFERTENPKWILAPPLAKKILNDSQEDH